MKPRVTIAIPTYNRAATFLPGVIKSALAQRYKPLEIVVSDNCSTDQTGEVVRSFDDPRLRYVRPAKNLGSNGNYNNCLAEASGAYLLVLHDDDLIDPDFVETCLARANYSTSYGMIRTGTRTIDATGNPLREKENIVAGDTLKDVLISWFNGDTVVYMCNTLYNTQVVRDLGGFRSLHNLFEDGIAIAKVLERHPVLNIREVKASFRKSPGQLTHSAPVRSWIEEFAALRDLVVAQFPGDAAMHEIGNRFFASQSVARALQLKQKSKRYRAYLTVLRHFLPWYWPRIGLVRLLSAR